MTEQEAAAINEAAKTQANEIAAFIQPSEEFPPKPKGATYAALESVRVNIPPSFQKGFLAGAKALDEMRKPSFDNRAKIQELLWDFSCDVTADPCVITEEIILLALNCKLPENIKQAIEDAVKEYAGISDDKFANSAKTYDAYNIDESFKNGAEFALRLSENSGQLDNINAKNQSK